MDVERIFRYKKYDVMIKETKNDSYQVGVRIMDARPDMIFWLEKAVYDDFEVAVNSGAEYARIYVDRIKLENKV